MNNAFLHWLTAVPTPWDLLASVAAAGSWFVAWRKWRHEMRSNQPIFDITAKPFKNRLILATLVITNREEHDLRACELRVLSPVGAGISRNYRMTPTGSQERDETAQMQSRVPLSATARSYGTPDAVMAGFFVVPGDHVKIEFMLRAPPGTARVQIALKLEPANVAMRPFVRKLAISLPENSAPV